MGLRYKLDEVLVRMDQKITDKVINNAFQKLLDNDFSIIPMENIKPEIWECKWFNNPSISGYSQGDACWINTEVIDDFIKIKHNQIYEYAKNNSVLTKKIKKYELNNYEIHELYKNILSGYFDKISNIKLEPIFELGNIQDKVQIRISKIDNNKHSIFDDRYWSDFFIRDSYDGDLKTIFNNSIQKHNEDYHLNLKDVSLDDYVDISLSNVSSIQRLQNHTCEYHQDVKTGLDYIKIEQEKYSLLNNIFVNISAIEDKQITKYWYELTADMVYRLNNSIPKDEIEQKLHDVKNFTHIQKFIPTDDSMGFGNVTLEIAPTSAYCSGTSFPNYFKYNEKQYNQIETQLSLYQVQNYCIGKIETTQPESDISGFYTLLTPLSIDNISSIPIHLRELYKKHSIKTIESTIVEKDEVFSIRDQWIKCFKSGYVIEGGFVRHKTMFDEQIFTIKLLQPYEYITTQRSIYNDVLKINDNINYTNNNTLREDDRYTVSITPISDSFVENSNIEIVGLRNDSFDILVGKNTPREFFYQVQGIIDQEIL